MASEKQVLERWQQLFRDGEQRENDVALAGELIDQLADCSPLRQRLTRDLDEIIARHELASGEDK